MKNDMLCSNSIKSEPLEAKKSPKSELEINKVEELVFLKRKRNPFIFNIEKNSRLSNREEMDNTRLCLNEKTEKNIFNFSSNTTLSKESYKSTSNNAMQQESRRTSIILEENFCELYSNNKLKSPIQKASKKIESKKNDAKFSQSSMNYQEKGILKPIQTKNNFKKIKKQANSDCLCQCKSKNMSNFGVINNPQKLSQEMEEKNKDFNSLDTINLQKSENSESEFFDIELNSESSQKLITSGESERTINKAFRIEKPNKANLSTSSAHEQNLQQHNEPYLAQASESFALDTKEVTNKCINQKLNNFKAEVKSDLDIQSKESNSHRSFQKNIEYNSRNKIIINKKLNYNKCKYEVIVINHSGKATDFSQDDLRSHSLLRGFVFENSEFLDQRNRSIGSFLTLETQKIKTEKNILNQKNKESSKQDKNSKNNKNLFDSVDCSNKSFDPNSDRNMNTYSFSAFHKNNMGKDFEEDIEKYECVYLNCNKIFDYQKDWYSHYISHSKTKNEFEQIPY